MHDVFESRRATLDELTGTISRQEGQIGALVAIGGRCKVIDIVSRSDVWAALHRPLVQGYALDAIDARMSDLPQAADAAIAEAFLDAVIAAPVTERTAVGVGVQVDVADLLMAGSGLALEDELLQLSVFANDTPRTRIRRPSRRA
jgi:hypothetical protein